MMMTEALIKYDNNNNINKVSDPFEGIEGTKDIPTMIADKKLKMAIVGRSKSGKSWFAATAPGNILMYDFDDRADSLETLPEIYKSKIRIKTLVDLTQSMPTAFQALESDLGRLKYRKSQGQPIPDTYIFDSGTYLKRAVENVFFKGGGSSRSLKVSPTTTILRGKDWDTINTVVGAFDYLITEYSQLGNVIFVFHERPQKDKTESTKDTTVYTDEVTIDPQYLEPIIARFNEYMRINLDYNQNYVVTCKPTAEFRGATTLLVDKEEKPSIMEMLAKHKQNLAKQKAEIY